LALISRTTSSEAKTAASESLPPEVERLLEDIIERGELGSPLDEGRAPAEDVMPAPVTEQVAVRRSKQVTGPAANRPPASKRVADELRAQYAIDSVL
jgi:hypothetical protein